MTYMTKHNNIVPGDMKFYNFGKSFLVVITIYMYMYSLSDLCSGVEKRLF